MTHSVAKTVWALVVVAFAASESSRLATASEPEPPAAKHGANPYSELTDQQWTAVVEGWERLDGTDRRWFLTEIRKRKVRVPQHRSGQRQPAIEYRERARFGYPAKPLDADLRDAVRGLRKPSPDDANGYGLGFEQRQRGRLAEVEPRVGEDAKRANVPTSARSAAGRRDVAPDGRQETPAERVPASSPRISGNAL